MMRRLAMRVIAVYAALIGINVYSLLIALPIANGFTWMHTHGVPLIVLLVVGLATVVGGIMLAIRYYDSPRFSLLMVAALGVVIALTPFLGMIAQEAVHEGVR